MAKAKITIRVAAVLTEDSNATIGFRQNEFTDTTGGIGVML
jgi:hypothetical protein